MTQIKTPKAGQFAPRPPGAKSRRIWKKVIDKRSGKTRLVIGTTQQGLSGPNHHHYGEAGRLHFAKMRLLKTVNGRGGVPNGIDRRGFKALLDKSLTQAKKAIEYMDKQNAIDFSGVPDDEVEKEKTALTFASAVVLTDIVPVAQRLKAADIVLKYTRGARQETNLKVENAEALLAAALKDASDQ